MVRETFGKETDDALAQLEYAGVPRDAVAVIRQRLRRDKRIVAAAIDFALAANPGIDPVVQGANFWDKMGVLFEAVAALEARERGRGMKVKTIAYGKTFNIGNYQSERIDMTADLDEGEDEQVALLRLKATVLGAGGDAEGAQRARLAVAAIGAELAE